MGCIRHEKGVVIILAQKDKEGDWETYWVDVKSQGSKIKRLKEEGYVIFYVTSIDYVVDYKVDQPNDGLIRIY